MSRNRYIYTHNNPVNYVDPSGHAANLVIGAVVGLAVGVATGIATGDVTAGVIAGASAGIGVATFGMATAAEEANDMTGTGISISRKKGGRWHHNPAYNYCTCYTKLVTTKKDYVYNANWQILSATTEAAGHEIIKECYSYDEAGNRTSYERWSGHKKLLHIRYEYNSANQLVTT